MNKSISYLNGFNSIEQPKGFSPITKTTGNGTKDRSNSKILSVINGDEAKGPFHNDYKPADEYRNSEYSFAENIKLVQDEKYINSLLKNSTNLYETFLQKVQEKPMTFNYFQYKLRDVHGDNLSNLQTSFLLLDSNERVQEYMNIKFQNNIVYNDLTSKRPNLNLIGPILNGGIMINLVHNNGSKDSFAYKPY